MRMLFFILALAAALAPGSPAAGFDLQVVFRGGDIPASFWQVIETLGREGLVRVESKQVAAAVRPVDVVRDELDLPRFSGWEPAVAAIVRMWNPDLTDPTARLTQDRRILMPDLDLDKDYRPALFDMASQQSILLLEKVRQQWGSHAEQESSNDDKRVRLRLWQYVLKVPFDSVEHLTRAVRLLEPLRSEQVALVHVSLPQPDEKLRFNVLLEGGEPNKDAQVVVKRLIDLKLVSTDKTTLRSGERPQDVYRRKMNVQGSFEKLLLELNPGVDPTRLRANKDTIVYPNIRFREYEWTLRIDRAKEQDRDLEHQRRTNWGYLLKDVRSVQTGQKATEKDRFVDLVFRGWELSLSAADPAALARAKAGLESLNMGNVRVSFPQTTERPIYGRYIPADQIRGQVIPSGEEVSAGCELGSCDPHDRLLAALPPTHVNKVIVLDPTPVDRTHPDLSPGLSLIKDGTQTIETRDYWPEDHATHLAGIVGAHANDFGIVGLNPQAELVDVRWKDGPAPKPVLQAQTRNSRVPVTLFASSWDLREERTLRPYLMESKPFWVVAAGQCSGDKPNTRDCDDNLDGIDLEFGLGAAERTPTNLSYLPNVLVVTGCDSCYKDGERIPSAMNRSRRRAHVAARSNAIYSLLSSRNYGRMSGTSQAAALVAGLASALASTYPTYYFEASALKRRIQVTSTAPRNPEMAVASGIVNLCAARLDPTKHHWITRASGPPAQVSTTCPEFQTFEPQAWDVPEIEYTEADGEKDTINVRHILRLQSTQAGWVIYTANRKEWLDAIVRRIGPVMVSGSPAIVLAAGTKVRLSELQDVIFRDSDPGPLGVAR